MIEIPRVRRPSPSAHLDSRWLADAFEPSISLILVERIAASVLAVKGSNRLRIFGMKGILGGNSHAGGRPHVANKNVLLAVAIEIEPAGAHPRARFLNPRFGRDHCERSVAVIPIQIAPPEVVGHVEIRTSI